jgi:transposase-like protein
MARQKRVFTPQYRAEAVQLVLAADKPIAEIARDLGIGESTLGNWVKKAREGGTVAEKELDINERAELKRLREELRVVKMERDFLKKAAAFFARESQ